MISCYVTTKPLFREMWIQASPHQGCYVEFLEIILKKMEYMCKKYSSVLFLSLEIAMPKGFLADPGHRQFRNFLAAVIRDRRQARVDLRHFWMKEPTQGNRDLYQLVLFLSDTTKHQFLTHHLLAVAAIWTTTFGIRCEGFVKQRLIKRYGKKYRNSNFTLKQKSKGFKTAFEDCFWEVSRFAQADVINISRRQARISSGSFKVLPKPQWWRHG